MLKHLEILAKLEKLEKEKNFIIKEQREQEEKLEYVYDSLAKELNDKMPDFDVQKDWMQWEAWNTILVLNAKVGKGVFGVSTLRPIVSYLTWVLEQLEKEEK